MASHHPQRRQHHRQHEHHQHHIHHRHHHGDDDDDDHEADAPLFDERAVFALARGRAGDGCDASTTPVWPDEAALAADGGARLRALRRGDAQRGLFDVLAQLTRAPRPDDAVWRARFDAMRAARDHYYVIVVERDARIAATATMFVERKFIRGCASVAHIEDVVVGAAHRGRGYGRALVCALVRMAWSFRRATPVYKVLLDCAADKEAFYVRAARFQRNAASMALYRDGGGGGSSSSRL